MTPKEEAEELVNKMYAVHSNSASDITLHFAKQCALIAVDETIEALNLLLKSGLNNDFDILKLRGFYMEIKQEIERI